MDNIIIIEDSDSDNETNSVDVEEVFQPTPNTKLLLNSSRCPYCHFLNAQCLHIDKLCYTTGLCNPFIGSENCRVFYEAKLHPYIEKEKFMPIILNLVESYVKEIPPKNWRFERENYGIYVMEKLYMKIHRKGKELYEIYGNGDVDLRNHIRNGQSAQQDVNGQAQTQQGPNVNQENNVRQTPPTQQESGQAQTQQQPTMNQNGQQFNIGQPQQQSTTQQMYQNQQVQPTANPNQQAQSQPHQNIHQNHQNSQTAIQRFTRQEMTIPNHTPINNGSVFRNAQNQFNHQHQPNQPQFISNSPTMINFMSFDPNLISILNHFAFLYNSEGNIQMNNAQINANRQVVNSANQSHSNQFLHIQLTFQNQHRYVRFTYEELSNMEIFKTKISTVWSLDISQVITRIVFIQPSNRNEFILDEHALVILRDNMAAIRNLEIHFEVFENTGFLLPLSN